MADNTVMSKPDPFREWLKIQCDRFGNARRLAIQADLQPSTISSIFAYTNRHPETSTIKKLAKATGTPHHEILDMLDGTLVHEEAPRYGLHLEKDEEQLVGHWRTASERDKAVVRQLLGLHAPPVKKSATTSR